MNLKEIKSNSALSVEAETRQAPSVIPHRDGAPSKEVISVNNLLKCFPGKNAVNALEAVSLSIKEREFVSILGPSGCGKSTLLRIVAGLVPYNGGELLVNGLPVTAPRAEIGVVFQTSNMLPWLTVEKNIALGARLRKLPEAQIGPKIRMLIKMLGLTGFENNHPHELSGACDSGRPLVRFWHLIRRFY